MTGESARGQESLLGVGVRPTGRQETKVGQGGGPLGTRSSADGRSLDVLMVLWRRSTFG